MGRKRGTSKRLENMVRKIELPRANEGVHARENKIWSLDLDGEITKKAMEDCFEGLGI